MFKNTREGKRCVGKPRKKQLDDVETNEKGINVLRLEKKAEDRDAWKLILKEARVLHGPQGQWRGGGHWLQPLHDLHDTRLT
jgi:hypothetical protein